MSFCSTGVGWQGCRSGQSPILAPASEHVKIRLHSLSPRLGVTGHGTVCCGLHNSASPARGAESATPGAVCKLCLLNNSSQGLLSIVSWYSHKQPCKVGNSTFPIWSRKWRLREVKKCVKSHTAKAQQGRVQSDHLPLEPRSLDHCIILSWGRGQGHWCYEENWTYLQHFESTSLLLFSCSVGPMGYSPPGSSVHGISAARILEWVAISFSWGSSWPRNGTCRDTPKPRAKGDGKTSGIQISLRKKGPDQGDGKPRERACWGQWQEASMWLQLTPAASSQNCSGAEIVCWAWHTPWRVSSLLGSS